MARKIQKMTLISGNRGFTIIEVIIAIVILVIAFGVLFDMLLKAKKDIESSKRVFENTIELDRKIKLKDFENIEISEKNLPDYPKVIEKTYTYGSIYFVIYEIK